MNAFPAKQPPSHLSARFTRGAAVSATHGLTSRARSAIVKLIEFKLGMLIGEPHNASASAPSASPGRGALRAHPYKFQSHRR